MTPQMQSLFGELRSALAGEHPNRRVLNVLKSSYLSTLEWSADNYECVLFVAQYLWGAGIRLQFEEIACLEPWENPIFEPFIILVVSVPFNALHYIPTGSGCSIETIRTVDLKDLWENGGQAFDLPKLKTIAAAKAPSDPYQISLILEEWGVQEFATLQPLNYFSVPGLVSLTAPFCDQTSSPLQAHEGKALKHLTITEVWGGPLVTTGGLVACFKPIAHLLSQLDSLKVLLTDGREIDYTHLLKEDPSQILEILRGNP